LLFFTLMKLEILLKILFLVKFLIHTLMQSTLKPQDLLVALKLAVNPERDFLLVQLSVELGMPLSVVHGCIKRAEIARLISRSSGSMRALRQAVREFVIHGAKYAFPAQLGAPTRGVPTAIGAPVLAIHFEKSEMPPVWPSPEGTNWGLALPPLHPAVLKAIENDHALYDVLALLDALRVGAARERELAANELASRFG
jgi:hypothetical protein